MATLKNLLIIFCILCGFTYTNAQSVSVRQKVTSAYASQIGVREKTGRNDGVMVETFLSYCGLPKGQPWCASFVCWIFGQSGVQNPRSGYCPDLFTANHVIYRRAIRTPQKIPEPGDIFGIYFLEKGRIAHTGFVDQWGENYVITVEGNTNDAGSREGDGVYRKRRPRSSIYQVASYINN